MFDTERPAPLRGSKGLSIIEILDRSFRIYRQNFFPFFLLTLVIQIPLTLITNTLIQGQFAGLQAAMVKAGLNPNQTTFTTVDPQVLGTIINALVGSLVVIVVLAAISAIVQAIAINGPLVYVTSENHLGRQASLGAALNVVA